jgi:UDP-2-acetamido-2-deoxy-ribo-hexuluronate aminotransferase
VATAEVIALLSLTPVMVDVDAKTFLITPKIFEKAITSRTKAVVPVHLFGQCADMDSIMEIAEKRGIFVIEDNAQAIGADFSMKNGEKRKSGTIGHIGTTSFFPSKNLGGYGDGGAIFTNDDTLAQKMRMVANHGESKKYFHDEIGVNSRLDSIQAAILNIKLARLDKYCRARQAVARKYDAAFKKIAGLQIPARAKNSTHVFHQYTLLVKNGKRDEMRTFLEKNGVPAMIYYPVPLYKQKAYASFFHEKPLPTTEMLCESVISLPIHTEMDAETRVYIIGVVELFFQQK